MLTGYVIYVRDSTLLHKFEWVIVRTGQSKTLNDTITYNDCYKRSGGANAVITRLTWGRTDCTNCMYRVIPITFDDEETCIKLGDVIESAYIYQ